MCRGRVQVCLGSERTTERTGMPGQMQVLKTWWYNAHDEMMKNNTQAKDKATTTNNWKTPGATVSGRYNTPPLQEDLVPRSRMAPERSGRGTEEVKRSCFWQKSETNEPWEVKQFKRKNTTKMNKVENTPLENRNKEHHENPVGWKTWEKGCNGQEVHASTSVDTRCTRNDKDQLRQHSGWKWKVKNMIFEIWKHLDETPFRRGMIDTTLWLKQDREGIRLI